MKTYWVMVLAIVPMCADAATESRYRSVYRAPQPQVNHHPDPMFNHQAPKPPVPPAYPYYDQRPYGYPSRPVVITRPQISINTPHVGIYVDPTPQYQYQRIEEVYLPQGGTYRSTTQYIPQYAQPVYPPQRRVVGGGHFYLNTQE